MGRKKCSGASSRPTHHLYDPPPQSSPCAAESHGLAAVPGGHELAPAGLGLAAQPPPVDAGGDHRVPEPEVIMVGTNVSNCKIDR